LNLVTCAFTQPLAAKMEASFGVPYAPLHNAFSTADIDEQYDSISKIFGVDFGDAFTELREQAILLEERACKELGNLTFVILPDVDMPVALTQYLAGFGMEPILITVSDLHPEDIGKAKEMKALGVDPPVCRIMNLEADIEIVRSLAPDISFGRLPRNYPSTHEFRVSEEMGDFQGMIGYERTIGILSRIFTVLETGTSRKRRV